MKEVFLTLSIEHDGEIYEEEHYFCYDPTIHPRYTRDCYDDAICELKEKLLNRIEKEINV